MKLLRGEADRAQDAPRRGQERVNDMRNALGDDGGRQYRTGSSTRRCALLLSAAGHLPGAGRASAGPALPARTMTLDKLRHAQRNKLARAAPRPPALTGLERNGLAVTRLQARRRG